MTANGSPLRLVVFDMDGTLMNSGDLIADAMRRAFEDEGLAPPEAAAVRRIVGLELYEAVRRLSPELPVELNHRIGDAYKNHFHTRRLAHGDKPEAPLYPGARAALARLSATETLLGVATGKARRGLDHALRSHDLTAFFVTTQTCSEAPGKPHPGMIENCLRETGAQARDAVVVGDTVYDMEMARNAGARAIGVSWGYHETDELRAAGAAAILETFEALDDALESLWRT